MAVQSDLFSVSPVAGLQYTDDIVDEAEERALVTAIDSVQLEPFRFQGWLGKRLTASFGWQYDFEHARFAAAEPLPGWLLPIPDRAAVFAGLPSANLVQALLIRYDPGAGIGWHRDRPVFEHVVGISFGAPAVVRLRRRQEGGFDRAEVPLPPRSAYHLSGEVRHGWEHSVELMAAARWSITFRSLSERWKRMI